LGRLDLIFVTDYRVWTPPTREHRPDRRTMRARDLAVT
jgi:hypothetical protein